MIAGDIIAAREKLLHLPVTGNKISIPQKRTECRRSNLLTIP